MASTLDISKTLQKEGFNPNQAKALENIFKERDKVKSKVPTNGKDTRDEYSNINATKGDLRVTELNLELKIEGVRKEISDSKTDLQKSINNQTKWFMGLITAYTATNLTQYSYAYNLPENPNLLSILSAKDSSSRTTITDYKVIGLQYPILR